MPTTVIKALEDMATSDSFKSLQLKTKSGSIKYDSTWIAGVDFTEDEEQEEYHYQVDDGQSSKSIARRFNPNKTPEQHEDSDSFIEEENDDDEDEDAIMDEATEEESTQLCRPTRTAKPAERYQAYKEQGYSQIIQPFSSNVVEDYTEEESKVLATIICQFKESMDVLKIQQGY
jgi:hypothetical protein